jgi:hypothetical protein
MLKSHSFIDPFPVIFLQKKTWKSLIGVFSRVFSRVFSLQVSIDPGDSWKIFTKALRRMARSAGTTGAMEITAATKSPEKRRP